MIKVDILKCTENVELGKDIFIEGELYYGRRSLNGDYYMILSDKGNWIPVKSCNKMTVSELSYMKEVSFFHTQNKKGLNILVREYKPYEMFAINEGDSND